MFCGGGLWASDELARDLSDACETTHSKRSKSCIAIDLTMIGLRRSAFNLTIYKLPDRAVLLCSDNSIRCLRPGFCFGQNIIFMSLGDYSPCVGKL